MELILPQFGLFFWTVVIFLIVLSLLRAFAWKPILAALQAREASINQALQAAEAARAEVEGLKRELERREQEALDERQRILNEAQAARDHMIRDAQDKARQERERLMQETRRQIEAETSSAKAELQAFAGELAVEIAERLLRDELNDRGQRQAYAKRLAETWTVSA